MVKDFLTKTRQKEEMADNRVPPANPNDMPPANGAAQNIGTRMEMLACGIKIKNWLGILPNDIQQEIRQEFGVMCRQAGLDELDSQRLIQDMIAQRPGHLQAFVGQVSRYPALVTAVRKLAGLL